MKTTLERWLEQQKLERELALERRTPLTSY
jgi:hypothetical protein